MPLARNIVLEPRKSPVQARSSASVDAILEATIQVLVDIGKERLTTTKVAHRAGVSVGTLYQYFPNKSALLQAALKRHLDSVAHAVESVCREKRGHPLEEMATALMTAFLNAKMENPRHSAALYAVGADVGAQGISLAMGGRFNKAIVAMLRTSSQPLNADPQLVASMLQGVMVGVSRRLLESLAPEKNFKGLLEELIFLARAYLNACAAKG